MPLFLPPLLPSAPEPNPPHNRRLLFYAAFLAILGMLIAWAAVTTGQDSRRQRDTLQMHYDLVYWQNALAQARLAQPPASPDEIAELKALVAKYQEAREHPPWLEGYAKYGRQFSAWDGYRYEEIVEKGYLYHQPNDSGKIKESPTVTRPDWPEPRLKNVVWYPLYPLLGYVLSLVTHLSANHALTVISWTCCVLAAVVAGQYARRHYFNRPNLLRCHASAAQSGEEACASQADTAAIWSVLLLLFGPCAVFFYANFTESLFLLLLVAFLYCLQSRWWWRAAIIAGIASASRSQGVLFGPILALVYLLHAPEPRILRKIPVAFLLGVISGIGIACYMLFLQVQFHDALAFMHAQKYWNVGINLDRLLYVANPLHAFAQIRLYGFSGEVDWPRLWQALCLFWPPIVLIAGRRYLTFELQLVGWMLWALPYISNSMAGNPPMNTPWMSMGRFMAVLIPAYIVAGAIFARRPRLALALIIPWTATFSVFAYKYGSGAWVG